MEIKAKKHHYVPQFFLRGFSIDGKHLWVFDRETKQYWYKRTEEMGAENKLYTYKHEGKEENLEELFSKVESTAKPVLQKLINKQLITDQDKAELAQFLALLKVRVPDFKKWSEEGSEKLYKKINEIRFSDKDNVKKMFATIGKPLSEKELDDLVEFAKDGNNYRIKFPSNYWLGTMLKLSIDIATAFIGMEWDIYYFNKKYALITSDNPILLVPPIHFDRFYGVGLISPGAKKVVALTSNIALVIGDLVENPVIKIHEILDKDFFRWINTSIVKSSDRFIYSPDRSKLEKLIKVTKVDKNRRTERVVIS